MEIQNLGDKPMSGGGSRSAVPHFDYFRDCGVGLLATLHIPNKNGYCECQTRLRKKAAANFHRLQFLWVGDLKPSKNL
jgi:hypothetical protein